MNVLVLNAGSSSLKFGLYRMQDGKSTVEQVLSRGIVDALGSEPARIRFEIPSDRPQIPVNARSAKHASAHILQMAADGKLADIPDIAVHAVGCRVVHGGSIFTDPTLVDSKALAEIRSLSDLAPLHNPIDADVIEAALAALPKCPVVAVFDTAFHHTLPEVAHTYALPLELCQEHGLRRYGFHGISHRYVSERLLERLDRPAIGTRLITCHLGNGASVCAIRDGKSVDTSMGLTPLEGLVMGTRSGDVDPGLLLYLLNSKGMTASELDDILNHKSGLAGIGGHSGDVRKLEKEAQAGNVQAELALDVFAYRVSKYIGAYAVALEGLDAIAFTGGIGEHSAEMREQICGRLEVLGLRLDSNLNRAADGTAECKITEDGAKIQAWGIPTDEELQIAREVRLLHR